MIDAATNAYPLARTFMMTQTCLKPMRTLEKRG